MSAPTPSVAFLFTNYTTPSVPTGTTVADSSGDGKLDIAMADSTGISVLPGNGDGTFQPAINSNLGSSYALNRHLPVPARDTA